MCACVNTNRHTVCHVTRIPGIGPVNPSPPRVPQANTSAPRTHVEAGLAGMLSAVVLAC